MSRILFITRHTPLPWEDGAGAYLFDLVEYLGSRGHEVHLVWLQPHEELKWKGVWSPPASFRKKCRLLMPEAFRVGACYFFPKTYWLPFKAGLFHRVKHMLQIAGLWRRRSNHSSESHQDKESSPGTLGGWMAPPSEAEVKFSNLIMTRIGPQVVIVNYPWLCPIFDAPVAEKLRKVCVSVDVGWRRAELLASHIRSGEPELNADQEAAWFRKADAIVAISAADALEFEQMASGRPVFVSPKACRPIMLDAGQSGQKGCCLFVGSSNSFNVEGLTWFLGSVWPTILAARPDATLLVAGTIEKVLTARPRGVKFLGQVSDLAPLYQGSQVVIVPLLRGTGMIIKLVEAAAHGCACVSTPKALEAATWLRGSVIETEDPLEFAAVTLRLLGDDSERTRRGAECRRIVMEELGQHRCYGPLSDWVEAQQV